jgi:hypothetical protein
MRRLERHYGTCVGSCGLVHAHINSNDATHRVRRHIRRVKRSRVRSRCALSPPPFPTGQHGPHSSRSEGRGRGRKVSRCYESRTFEE